MPLNYGPPPSGLYYCASTKVSQGGSQQGGALGLSGCIGSSASDSNDGSDDNSDVDTGTILERDIQNPVEEQVTLAEGQTIVVQTRAIESGEELLFTVGDGTGFVVREHFDEDDTREFRVETDGPHNLRLSPKRHEVPMNEDVTIQAEVSVDGA